MILDLTLAGMLVLASGDVPHPKFGRSLKDPPIPHMGTSSHQVAVEPYGAPRDRPPAPKPVIPPTPESNLYDRMDAGIQPFIRIEGALGRLAVSRETLDRYKLNSGDTVPPSVGEKIIREMLDRMGR